MTTQSNIIPIKSFSPSELKERLAELGYPAFRSNQIIRWLYQRGVSSYDQMTDLPKDLRSQLAGLHPLYVPTIVDRRISQDGTRKYLLSFHDGCLVETVGIPSDDGRLTVCFSTQVGCPMGCVFCATGYEGFTRNLSIGEIIDQVLVVQSDFGQRVTNLVGMGQGEPFLNFESVFGALALINSKNGLNIGSRKITISTCGIISGINKMAAIPHQYTLAVSLHSARQQVRDYIMPKASSNPLPELKRALMSYIQQTNRRVTFEYTLINDVNDSEDDLRALLNFADGLLCHINLIPMNSVQDSPFQATRANTLEHWRNVITEYGIEATVRRSRGSDICGACGQLKNIH